MNEVANRIARRLGAAAIGILPIVFAHAVPAGDPGAGREKAGQCTACHGRDGLSRRPDVPHIAGQSEIYLKEQLRRYRSGKRVHPEMNIIARNLSDEDISDLVAWFSQIELEVKLPE